MGAQEALGPGRRDTQSCVTPRRQPVGRASRCVELPDAEASHGFRAAAPSSGPTFPGLARSHRGVEDPAAIVSVGAPTDLDRDRILPAAVCCHDLHEHAQLVRRWCELAPRAAPKDAVVMTRVTGDDPLAPPPRMAAATSATQATASTSSALTSLMSSARSKSGPPRAASLAASIRSACATTSAR